MAPPVGHMEGRGGGREGHPLPGGPKRKLVENPNALPVALAGGDGGGSSKGNEVRGG